MEKATIAGGFFKNFWRFKDMQAAVTPKPVN
jgi:hypothetical protein